MALPKRGELSPDSIQRQAEALAEYVRKPGVGRGAVSRWLDSKDFAPADRTAILLAWADLFEEMPSSL